MKTIKRNEHKRNELPPGAEQITPITLKLGTIVPLVYDAKLERHGVTWYRVVGGFGGSGDREDWVADLAFGCSANDYTWNGEKFGPDYGTFDNACLQTLLLALRHARAQVVKLREDLASLSAGVTKLEGALGLEESGL